MESLCRICLGEGATISIFDEFNSEDGSNSTIQNKLCLCLNDKLEDMAGYPRYICAHCLETLSTVFDFINKYKETCKKLEERIHTAVVKHENNEDYEEYDEYIYPGDLSFETFEPTQKKIKIEFEDGAHLIEKIKPKLKASENKKNNEGALINRNCEEKAPLITKNELLFELNTTNINKKEDSINKDNKRRPLTKPLLKLKTTENKKIKKETPLKNTIVSTQRNRNYQYKTNRVASSLLEGHFIWNGEDWCPTTVPANNALRKECGNEDDQIEKYERDRQQRPKAEKRSLDPILCECCGETFLNKEKLRSHEENIRKRGVKVTCSVCNAQIAISSLNRHMKTLHSNEKQFICNVCGKGFAYNAQLNVHIRGVHEKTLPKTQYRRMPCKFCDKDFITKKLLLCHERMAHTGERPEVCSVCEKKFTHEDYLREHMRLHTGECPFECPVCGRGYPHRGNMKSHMRNHRMSELSQETLSKIKPSWCKLQPQAVRISSSALEGVISNKIREMNGQEMKRIRTGRNRQGWMNPAEAEQRELLMQSARAWMELAPEMAASEPATVEVGQPTRLLIQCTLPVGVGLRVTNCVAHDGLGEVSQKLLDEAGCPIDETIFNKPTVHHHKHRGSEIDFSDLEPVDLQRNIEENTNLKLAKNDPEYMLKNIMTYQHAMTTFAAFKFPDRAKLHLTCGIELCKGHCPIVDCKALQKSQQRRDGLVRKARLDKDAKGVVIERLEVYNSIEVLAPNIELEDEASIRGSRRIESEDEDFVRGFSPGDKTICLSPGKMALAFCVLGVIFLCAIAVAFASLVRARRCGRDPLHTSLSFYTGSKSLFSSSDSSSSGLSGSKLLLTDSPYLDQHSSSSNNWPYSRAF